MAAPQIDAARPRATPPGVAHGAVRKRMPRIARDPAWMGLEELMTDPLRAALALVALLMPLPAAAFNLTPSKPKPAPAVAFQDAQGNPLSLEDFRGQVVVLNLWATWCGPCRQEMPSLDHLQAEAGGAKLHVLALSVDRTDLAQIQTFYRDTGIQHLNIYRDPSAAASRALGAFGLPTTLVIDAEGREVGRVIGPAEWDSAEALAALRAVMATTTHSHWGGVQAAADAHSP
jgi:thiol-disulfide isomerase/thioredoxin